MSAPKFSVGVDADPMMVEQTIDKTLEEIINERRKEVKGKQARTGRGWLYFCPLTLRVAAIGVARGSSCFLCCPFARKAES